MNANPTVLVTGGAGFIGARLALGFKEHFEASRVIALDNLKRRGSELNLSRLRAGGVEYVHGDVRNPGDLPALDRLDLLIECSAEPSVLAGYGEAPDYVIDSNLFGAVNCLEYARRRDAAVLFLSTSRVYPVRQLCAIGLRESATRFEIEAEQTLPGVSAKGISESFPLDGVRSLYGATKYAAEILIAEYNAMYQLPCIVNRCGVVAGPWQMGRVDQGVLALWVARHVYGGALSYIGFGGSGRQVRDMLHVDDLLDLTLRQAATIREHHGDVYNVGGGRDGSCSLLELTTLCREATGRAIDIQASDEERPADIPLYITDNTRARNAYGWLPRHDIKSIVGDTTKWIVDHQEQLRSVLAG